jgi:hypothetical protein
MFQRTMAAIDRFNKIQRERNKEKGFHDPQIVARESRSPVVPSAYNKNAIKI